MCSYNIYNVHIKYWLEERNRTTQKSEKTKNHKRKPIHYASFSQNTRNQIIITHVDISLNQHHVQMMKSEEEERVF